MATTERIQFRMWVQHGPYPLFSHRYSSSSGSDSSGSPSPATNCDRPRSTGRNSLRAAVKHGVRQ